MTMENMGELHNDQQIVIISSTGSGVGGDTTDSSAGSSSPSTAAVAAASDIINQQQQHEQQHDLSSPRSGTTSTTVVPAATVEVSAVANMIDASDFRAHQIVPEPTYQTLNGRMSPGYNATNHSYATLTPLQPLPPISTVSDKFSHGPSPSVSGGFTLMQNNTLGHVGNVMDMNAAAYRYDKISGMGMNMNMGHSLAGAAPAMSMMSSNGYAQQSLGSYPAYSQNGIHSPKPEHKPMVNLSPNTYDAYSRGLGGPGSRLGSPNHMMHQTLNGLSSPSPSSSGLRERPTSANDPTGGAGGSKHEIEEINTKELAQKISSELKRYSIPQAVFAQRVLCRSQGTLSDLLRNPKPWSKLKSGRETFRRMWKWLQEPEFQRMSALRLAVDATVKSEGGSGISYQGRYPCSGEQYTSMRLSGAEDLQSHLQQSALQACKRKEQESQAEENKAPKKPRLVFTDIQRRTLHAIFKETKRPSKEMQATIAQQLGLEVSTVANFFMNARRRSLDKWKDEDGNNNRESMPKT
ncbi:one cut domain family member 2-like [Tubulanus polymorphus]|uniref:one cut domain family member 2-like n=1 Tax=Tubulanus polymorphus TaxID=672921 RepID=UPI003DA5EF75